MLKKWFFNKYEKEFFAYLNKKNSVKITKDNLALSFFDLDGNAYYKFPKELELPITRTAKVQEYLMWLSKGISPDEYLKALDVADKALTEGLLNKKGGAKIGFILEELKDRCKMVIHDELFYNIIAAQIIRQDESITEFNNEIHLQKVAAFKELDQTNDTFFLNIQEYLEVFGLLSITKIQYEALLNESRIVRQSLEKMLNTL
jgi:hypothetical protein